MKVEKATLKGKIGIPFTAFTIVFREVFETVLFISGYISLEPIDTAIGVLIGCVSAFVLAYMIMVIGLRIDLSKLFYYTGMLIVLIASGLAGYGTHEFIEYFEYRDVDLGWFSEKAFELPIPRESLLHHKNAIGSLLAVMFGYTVSAEWGRVLVQLTYLLVALPLLITTYRRKP